MGAFSRLSSGFSTSEAPDWSPSRPQSQADTTAGTGGWVRDGGRFRRRAPGVAALVALVFADYASGATIRVDGGTIRSVH
jgi:hypothetical protein